MAVDSSRFPHGRPEIAGRHLGIIGSLFLDPNRCLSGPIFGSISSPISERLKYDKIVASLAAIRAPREGLPVWWRVGRDPPMINRESRTTRWELTDPSFWAIIEATDSLFSATPKFDIRVSKMRQNCGILRRD